MSETMKCEICETPMHEEADKASGVHHECFMDHVLKPSALADIEAIQTRLAA